jgi:hypothetical protein
VSLPNFFLRVPVGMCACKSQIGVNQSKGAVKMEGQRFGACSRVFTGPCISRPGLDNPKNSIHSVSQGGVAVFFVDFEGREEIIASKQQAYGTRHFNMEYGSNNDISETKDNDKDLFTDTTTGKVKRRA